MKARYKSHPEHTFEASQLNVHALAEVLTGDDSAFFRDLEVYIAAKQEWKCLEEAFRDGDVITDNYNTFFVPANEDDRKRRYAL